LDSSADSVLVRRREDDLTKSPSEVTLIAEAERVGYLGDAMAGAQHPVGEPDAHTALVFVRCSARHALEGAEGLARLYNIVCDRLNQQ
jgi:hypothetical protein